MRFERNSWVESAPTEKRCSALFSAASAARRYAHQRVQTGLSPAPTKAAVIVLPLALVLRACSDIADYARGGIAYWRDLRAAAGVMRMALG
jgi:hypothetical protein